MKTTSHIKNLVKGTLLALPVLALSLAVPMQVLGAVSNPTPSAKVSFTFDDGFASVYDQAAPTLAQYGIKGTSYLTTGCVGMTTVPNNCRANDDTPYMTWEQIQALKNTYGWEIGSHTVNHPLLASTDPDDQPNLLTPEQIDQELSQSKADLAAHGIDTTAFAPPYGDYDHQVIAMLAKYYTSMRGFADVDDNSWPENDYLLNNMPVQAGVTVAQVKSRIDQAIANNEWLILTFHDIKVNPSSDPGDYEYSTANLAEIAAYVKSKPVAVPTVSGGLVTSDTNLLTNGGFENGMTGWTTNNAANVKADNTSKGSYPNAANSVSLTAGSGNNHLFSPKVTVNSDDTYMIKSYLNLVDRTSGELGYYIDEYDVAGNWISGQWKHAETSQFAKMVNLTYTPSSANVKKASMQVYVTANSGIQAYVDTFQWFSLTGDDTLPPPATVDLMTNGNFDGGITAGWTTNNASAFTADNGSHGSPANPVNSVKMAATAGNTHLFSPKIDVTTGTSYTVKSFVNVTARNSGEVGFYIDEYDVAGNWISGQYQLGKSTIGSEEISFSYVPTSANVKKSSLQVILVGNSGIAGYVDNVQWLAPSGTTPPPPAPTNLVPNGTFDSGIGSGWTTNDAINIRADNQNNGHSNNPLNSVILNASAQDRHLFSPQVTVDPTKSYNLAAYLDLRQRTGGEVGFYIDEYDAAGNWISGQWKAAVSSVSATDVSFGYTPSSASVVKASFQVYVTANSGIVAYVDHIRWFQN